MNLHGIAIWVLFTMSSLLGIEAVHLGPHADQWSTTGAWVRDQDYLTFEARSAAIPELCRERPNGVVEFPQVIQGAHEFYVDGHLIARYGDRTFRTVEKFYGRPVVNCAMIGQGKELTWRVWSFVDYFARITNLPTVTAHASAFNLFAETFHTVAGGAMIIMAIYVFFLFYGPVSLSLTLSVCGSCVLMAFYFLSCSSDAFGFTAQMLSLHKFADVSLWAGLLLLLNAYRIEGMVTPFAMNLYGLSGVVGSLIVLNSRAGDEVQLGTTMPFSFGLLSVASILSRVHARRADLWSNGQGRLQILSLVAFSFGLAYEVCAITGLTTTPPLLPFTQVAGVLFLVLSVNQRTASAYRERDQLRGELECWVPPFVRWAVQQKSLTFPVQRDLTGITFDIVNSSAYHDVVVDGRPLRSQIIRIFSECIIRHNGWRESHSGDSAYGHFGLEGGEPSADAALAVAREFRSGLKDLATVGNVPVECGIGLHLAKNALVDIHTVQVSTTRGDVVQKSFDTTSIDIDLLHRIEKLAHDLPGTNIVMSRTFRDQLREVPADLIPLGRFGVRGQKEPVELFLLKSPLVEDEHVDRLKAKGVASVTAAVPAA